MPFHRLRTFAVALLATSLLPLVGATPAQAGAGCVDGSAGRGDPFFPSAGNGGYDVGHYRIDLSYDPASHRLAATTRITATATATLCRFDLDFRGPHITTLTVNGHPAGQVRHGQQELVVTPARPLPQGQTFTVAVRYAGAPQAVIDPDGSLDGWIRTDDGAFVASEPQGSPSWFPCNDDPRDKATYDVRATVPGGVEAVGNGDLVGRSSSRGRTTFHWRDRTPMSTYLATLSTGRFQITTGRTPRGVPIYNAVDPREAAASAPALAEQGAIVDFYSSVFGPYPYSSVGAIVDHAPRVGYSLETQTRPVYAGAPSEMVVAHELAHQWFGDSVTLGSWPQIWVNEGFATWSSWWWRQHSGGETARRTFQRLYANPARSAIWSPPPARPGKPANLFAASVYLRGGMTLEALREKIGTADFLTVLRRWATIHRYGTGTTAQFQTLAEQVSGQPLLHFFNVWLRTPGKPAHW